MIEQWAYKPLVVGSNPIAATFLFSSHLNQRCGKSLIRRMSSYHLKTGRKWAVEDLNLWPPACKASLIKGGDRLPPFQHYNKSIGIHLPFFEEKFTVYSK